MLGELIYTIKTKIKQRSLFQFDKIVAESQHNLQRFSDTWDGETGIVTFLKHFT